MFVSFDKSKIGVSFEQMRLSQLCLLLRKHDFHGTDFKDCKLHANAMNFEQEHNFKLEKCYCGSKCYDMYE